MVYILIVTYGRRWQYLSAILEQVCSMNDVRIVIMDNASDYPLDENLKAFDPSRVVYLSSVRNLGSAGGFHLAMQYALKAEDCSHIWLLDDDNLPDPDCLEVLRKNRHLLDTPGVGTSALMCLRADRKYLVNVASGAPVERNFPQPNAFLGFSIRKLLLLRSGGSDAMATPVEHAAIPCAPYGGLFFSKTLLHQIGLPDERFFLYADDFEFTMRITNAGGNIWLLGKAVIHDLEPSGQDMERSGQRLPVFLRRDDNRLFYSVRNYIYFQKKYLVNRPWVFALHRILYTGYLFILSAFTGRLARFNRFQEAVRDGLSGVFNNSKYPLN